MTCCITEKLFSGPKMNAKGASYDGKYSRIKVKGVNGKTTFRAKLIRGIYYVFPKIESKERNVKF